VSRGFRIVAPRELRLAMRHSCVVGSRRAGRLMGGEPGHSGTAAARWAYQASDPGGRRRSHLFPQGGRWGVVACAGGAVDSQRGTDVLEGCSAAAHPANSSTILRIRSDRYLGVTGDHPAPGCALAAPRQHRGVLTERSGGTRAATAWCAPATPQAPRSTTGQCVGGATPLPRRTHRPRDISARL